MRKTESPILAAVHDTAKGLFKAGAMDQITLREFDQLCLPPVEPLQPEQIKHIREASRVSQAVFARLLNTSLLNTRLLIFALRGRQALDPDHRCVADHGGSVLPRTP